METETETDLIEEEVNEETAETEQVITEAFEEQTEETEAVEETKVKKKTRKDKEKLPFEVYIPDVFENYQSPW